jgi:Zn finger protein HypA/HybF involved in hydrogenase expression
MHATDQKNVESKMNIEKKPMRVKCEVCKHEWAPLFLPMPIDMVVKITKNAMCPMCGTDAKRISILMEKNK